MIRTLLVDDSPEFLKAAKTLLSTCSSLLVVGQAQSGSEALRQIQTLRPDLVLMDIAMPGMSGLEATRRLKNQNPPPRVVILTMHDNSEYRHAAQTVGADDFIPKSNLADQLDSLCEMFADKLEH